MGIRVDRIRLLIYGIVGLLSSTAGMLYVEMCIRDRSDRGGYTETVSDHSGVESGWEEHCVHIPQIGGGF